MTTVYLSAESPHGRVACPKCLQRNVTVADSRPSKSGLTIRRRKRCGFCGYRWNTIEQQVSAATDIARLKVLTDRAHKICEELADLINKQVD